MNLRRLLLLAVVVALVAGFFASGLQQHLSLDALKAQQQVLDQQVTSQPMLASALYVGLYVLVTALSLPGAALLTLIGGALFGLGWGLLLVSFASTAGATLAMLISRLLLQDWFSSALAHDWNASIRASTAKARSTCLPCGWCRRFRSF